MLAAAAAGTVALALYVKLTPGAARIRPSEPMASSSLPSAGSVKPTQQIFVPVPSYQGERLSFAPRSVSVPAGDEAKVDAVNRFLQEAKLLDPSVRLMSLDLEDGIANLHFTQGFDAGLSSTDEATLIYGLRAAVGQFPEIRHFRIFVEGEQLDALGHIEFGEMLEPIPVSRWNDPSGETTEQTPPPSMPR
jgi:hypothetical protein